jgi:hypothetical protein
MTRIAQAQAASAVAQNHAPARLVVATSQTPGR